MLAISSILKFPDVAWPLTSNPWDFYRETVGLPGIFHGKSGVCVGKLWGYLGFSMGNQEGFYRKISGLRWIFHGKPGGLMVTWRITRNSS